MKLSLFITEVIMKSGFILFILMFNQKFETFRGRPLKNEMCSFSQHVVSHDHMIADFPICPCMHIAL